jgi:plastocyanin
MRSWPARGVGALLAGLISGHASATHYVIDINHMKFGPPPVRLNVGDTIEWKNSDIFRHTATARGAFDVDLPPGGTGTITLKTAGPVLVSCRYHPNMAVQLVVKDAKN